MATSSEKGGKSGGGARSSSAGSRTPARAFGGGNVGSAPF
jgi:hypothetical protein